MLKEKAILPSLAPTLRCVMSFAAYIILIDCILNCWNNYVNYVCLVILTGKKKKKKLFYAPKYALLEFPEEIWKETCRMGDFLQLILYV